MAVAVAITDRDVEGSSYVRRGTLTFSSTYSTGGEAPASGWPAALELSASGAIRQMTIGGGGGAAVGVVPEWDAANDKVKLYRTDQVDDFQEELPNGTSISSVLRFEAKGY